ncbi:EAL domain-containing protein, partial [Klebsiella pneumoniae]
HGDVLMWLMKTLLTSGCTNQRGAGHSGSDVPILDTIIMLSHKLGLNIVAEGVSSEHQLSYILDHNVGFIQGYLYAKPMCSSDFTRWLDTRANEQNDRIKCKKCSINQ